jgi:hypothetical protein
VSHGGDGAIHLCVELIHDLVDMVEPENGEREEHITSAFVEASGVALACALRRRPTTTIRVPTRRHSPAHWVYVSCSIDATSGTSIDPRSSDQALVFGRGEDVWSFRNERARSHP